MKIEDAYQLAISKVEGLREYDVIVTIRASESRSDLELIKQYSVDAERIESGKWNHVGLSYKTEEQWQKIQDTLEYLNSQGIQFETGGWEGYRNWELDWSFRYTVNED